MKSLEKAIIESEGYRSRVYKDSLGIDTIGYGFAIKDLELDETICNLILNQKLDVLKNRVYKKFEWLENSPEEIQNVVIEMCYQLGVTGVSKFKKTISYLQKSEWANASVEMLDSKWAKQTPNRAKKLSEIVKGHS